MRCGGRGEGGREDTMTQLPVRSPIFTDSGAAMFAISSLLLGFVKVSVGSIEVGGSTDSRQSTRGREAKLQMRWHWLSSVCKRAYSGNCRFPRLWTSHQKLPRFMRCLGKV